MPNASKKTLSTIAAAPPADAPQEDHRVRTGVLRREQTRRRLLVAAMGVFAEKVVVAPLIDDFIAAADVARGTFYNYFSTTQELLDAVTSELSDSVMFEIDTVVVTIHDPLERLAQLAISLVCFDGVLAEEILEGLVMAAACGESESDGSRITLRCRVVTNTHDYEFCDLTVSETATIAPLDCGAKPASC